MNYFLRKNVTPNVIKRAGGLMTISTDKFLWIDSMNYVGKISLAKFGQTWINDPNFEIEKDIYPYGMG